MKCQLTRVRFAFTIIELLVVLGLIALLVAIILPALGAARLTARNRQGQENLRQISIAVVAYATANNGYSPTDAPVLYDNYPTEPLAERSGGWLLWHETEDNPRDGAGQGSAVNRYLGLGHLIRGEYVTIEAFFHPVMRESTGKGQGASATNWYYRHNIGRMPDDPGYYGDVKSPGPYPEWVGCTVAYRNSDRSDYVLDYASRRPDLDIANNLFEAPRFNEQVLLLDTPWDNQGRRANGSLGYALGDGSVHTHGLAPFLGSADRRSFSNADIQVLNPDGGYTWPVVPEMWSTNNLITSGGPAVGWWAYLIDQSR